MNKLTVKLTQPDKKIIATWKNREVKIINFHCEKKISNFTKKDFNELEVKLITLQRFVGINQLIGDLEMEMLIEFLAEELKDFTLNEIEYAIKLAVAGHIEVKVDHWQAFTAQYLYPIFSKYRLLRMSILGKYHKAEADLQEQTAIKERPIQTKEDIFLSNKKMCESAFENYKLKISIIGMHRVFDILWDLNLIPYTKDKMKSFETMAAAELKSAAMKEGGRDKTIYESYLYSLRSKIDIHNKVHQQERPHEFERTLTGHNAIVNKTKEIAVRQIFAYLIEQNTEISTYFETLNLEK